MIDQLKSRLTVEPVIRLVGIDNADKVFSLHDRGIKFIPEHGPGQRAFAIGQGPASMIGIRNVTLHELGIGAFDQMWNSAKDLAS